MKPNLVIFDFDGTLTTRDSMLAFTRFYHGDFRFLLGLLYLSPSLLSYRLGRLPNWRAKEHFLTYFFGGEPLDRFQQSADRFASEKIPALLRPAAVRRLEAHRRNGDQLVVISSSAENWLRAWCRDLELPLLATRLQVTDGRITGKLNGPNCYGQEKVNRLREQFDPADFAGIVVYGDSRGDRELLRLATQAHFKPFR